MQACWSPSGRLFTLVLPDNSIWLIDVENAEVVRRIVFAKPSDQSDVSNNSKRELAEVAKEEQETVQRWELREVECEDNVDTSEAERNTQKEDRESILRLKTIELSQENVHDVCFSRDKAYCNNEFHNRIIAITWTTLPSTTMCKTTSQTDVQHAYRNLAMHVALPPFTNALFAEMHMLDESHTILHSNHSSCYYHQRDDNNDLVRSATGYNHATPLPLLLVLTSAGVLHVVLGGLREVYCIKCFDCKTLAFPFDTLLTNSQNYSSENDFKEESVNSSAHITQFIVSHVHKKQEEDNKKEDEYTCANKDEFIYKYSNFTTADILALLHNANHVNHRKYDSEVMSCSDTVLYLIVQNTTYIATDEQSSHNTLYDKCVESHLYKVNVRESLQQLFANNHVSNPVITSTTQNAQSPLLTWVCVAEHSLFALNLACKIISKWTQYTIPTLFITQLQLHKFAHIIMELLVERCVMLDEVRLLSYLCTLNLPQLWQRKKEIATEGEYMKALVRHLVLPHLHVALQLASSAKSNSCEQSNKKKKEYHYFTKLVEDIGKVIHVCEHFIARCLIVEARHVDHLLQWLVQRSSLLLNACDEVELQKIILEKHRNNYYSSDKETNKTITKVEPPSTAEKVIVGVEEGVSFDIDELSGVKQDNDNNNSNDGNSKSDDRRNSIEENTPFKWYRPGVVYNVEPLSAEWHPSLFELLNTFQTYFNDNQEWASEALTLLTSCIKEVHSGKEQLLLHFTQCNKCTENEISEASNNVSNKDDGSECNVEKVLLGDNNKEALTSAFIDLEVMPCKCNAIKETTSMPNEQEEQETENKLFTCYTLTPPIHNEKKIHGSMADTLIDEHEDERVNNIMQCYQRTYETSTNSCNSSNHYDTKHTCSGTKLQMTSSTLVENLSNSSSAQNTNANNNDCKSEIVYYRHLNDGRHLFVLLCNTTHNVNLDNRKSNSSVEVITMKEREVENESDENESNQKHITFTGKQTVSIQGLRELSISTVCVSVSKAREFIVIAANDTVIVIDLYAEDDDDDDDDNEVEGNVNEKMNVGSE